jgi:hypothetical protein
MTESGLTKAKARYPENEKSRRFPSGRDLFCSLMRVHAWPCRPYLRKTKIIR